MSDNNRDKTLPELVDELRSEAATLLNTLALLENANREAELVANPAEAHTLAEQAARSALASSVRLRRVIGQAEQYAHDAIDRRVDRGDTLLASLLGTDQ